MKKITLTQGQFAIVDDEDFEWLSQWKWYAMKVKSGNFYAYRWQDKPIAMHRELVNGHPNRVDHWNRDTLDNRRRNLRGCTNSQNIANSSRRKDNTSGYKGVHFVSNRPRNWRARAEVNGKKVHLGFFDTPQLAHAAYSAFMKQTFGEFARVD